MLRPLLFPPLTKRNRALGRRAPKAAGDEYTEGDMAALTALMASLSDEDRGLVIERLEERVRLQGEALARAEGEKALWEQLEALIGRARDLDPAFAARGDDVTVGEAVAVLRQHGESLGVSDEVLEMPLPMRDDEG